MDYYHEYLDMSFWYSALFKEVTVDELKWQHAEKKREMVWLSIHAPVHLLCTGGSSKEGSKNNHSIKNKETNNCLGSEALSFHLAAQRLRTVMSI